MTNEQAGSPRLWIRPAAGRKEAWTPQHCWLLLRGVVYLLTLPAEPQEAFSSTVSSQLGLEGRQTNPHKWQYKEHMSNNQGIMRWWYHEFGTSQSHSKWPYSRQSIMSHVNYGRLIHLRLSGPGVGLDLQESCPQGGLLKHILHFESPTKWNNIK